MKSYIKNSKHRALLKSAAMRIDASFSIGKGALTPEIVEAVSEYIGKHEIAKVGVLKNCDEDLQEMAVTLAERAQSELVQIIGHKIVLYRPAKKPEDRQYEWPQAKKPGTRSAGNGGRRKPGSPEGQAGRAARNDGGSSNGQENRDG